MNISTLKLSDLVAVQVIIDGETIAEVRVPDAESVEHVIASFSSLREAIDAVGKFDRLSPDACVAAIALTQISGLAGRISVASDEVGSGMYATKSHMRSWAKQMLAMSSDVLNVLHQRAKDAT